MGLGWHRNRTPIGLDIGSSHVRMLQLERHGPGWSVVAAACRSWGEDQTSPDTPAPGAAAPATLQAVIRDMLEHHPFRGRRVVSCLPVSTLQCKNIRLPAMPRDELAAAIEWEAADRLHLSVSDMQLQYLDAGEVRQGEELRHEIILLAALSRDVASHLETLSACDLTPVAIDATPCALARCVMEGQDNASDAPGVHVVLDVGQRQSKITMIREGRIVFFKVIDMGGQTLDNAVAQQLNLSMAEARALRQSCEEAVDQSPSDPSANVALFGQAKRENVSRAVYESLRGPVGELAREVGLCLRYYSVTFRGSRPEVLTLVGGESNQAYLASLIAQGAGLDVRPCPMLVGMAWPGLAGSDDRRVNLGQWAVAAGLALRHDSLLSVRGAA